MNLRAIGLAGVAGLLLAGGTGCGGHRAASAVPCTPAALSRAPGASPAPPGWKVAWYACGEGWAIAAGNSSVGFGIAAFQQTPAGWKRGPMDDGGYFADAPGHLCGGLPREFGLPPYPLVISLVRHAGLVVSGCAVGPPSPGRATAVPQPSQPAEQASPPTLNLRCGTGYYYPHTPPAALPFVSLDQPQLTPNDRRGVTAAASVWVNPQDLDPNFNGGYWPSAGVAVHVTCSNGTAADMKMMGSEGNYLLYPPSAGSKSCTATVIQH